MRLYTKFLAVAAVATAGLVAVSLQMEEQIEDLDKATDSTVQHLDRLEDVLAGQQGPATELEDAVAGLDKALKQAVCYHAYFDAIAAGQFTEQTGIDALGAETLEVTHDSSEFQLDGPFNCTDYLNRRLVNNECNNKAIVLKDELGVDQLRFEDVREQDWPVPLNEQQLAALGPYPDVQDGVLQCSDHLVRVNLDALARDKCIEAYDAVSAGQPLLPLSERHQQVFGSDHDYIEDGQLNCQTVLGTLISGTSF